MSVSNVFGILEKDSGQAGMTRKVALLMVFSVAAFISFCSPAAFAFEVPERLEYDLLWAGIKAGEAVLEVKKDGENIKISSTAKSAKWISLFYKVDDSVVVEAGGSNSAFSPIKYRIRLREGSYRRDREFIFGGGKVLYIDNLKDVRSEHDVPEEIYDPLSAFYIVRVIGLTVGKSVHVPVFDSRKLWDIEVQVLAKEKVETPLGVFDTVLLKPLMKTEGIFKRKGDIYIWVTDDETKMPVKLRSKAPIGSINAVLVRKTP